MDSDERPFDAVTAFTIVQGLDGSIGITTETGLKVVHQPTSAEYQAFSRFVYDCFVKGDVSSNAPTQQERIAQALAERQAESAE